MDAGNSGRARGAWVALIRALFRRLTHWLSRRDGTDRAVWCQAPLARALEVVHWSWLGGIWLHRRSTDLGNPASRCTLTMSGRASAGVLPWSWPQLLLAAVGVAVGVVIIVAASTSGVAFGAFNPGWDGATVLQAEATAVEADTTVVTETSAYTDVTPAATIGVILSPETGYEPQAVDHIRSFVRSGGTLVVAEDYRPHSNALLQAIGASARVAGPPLRDERSLYRSPAMPVATNVSAEPAVADVSQLTLNHGTAVRPNGTTVLATTSEYGYLDTNRDGNLSATESLGAYPVVTVESVGSGTVYVVSDPSLFINAMVDRPGNQAFVRALFDGHSRVLLDYSHTARFPPLAATILLVRESALLQVGLGAVFVGAVVAWVGRPNWRERIAGWDDDSQTDRLDPTVSVSATALVAQLRERYPTWDRETAERLVRTVREPDD